MGNRSVTEPPKLNLFDLPPPLIASVIESLLFEEEIVGFVVTQEEDTETVKEEDHGFFVFG